MIAVDYTLANGKSGVLVAGVPTATAAPEPTSAIFALSGVGGTFLIGSIRRRSRKGVTAA